MRSMREGRNMRHEFSKGNMHPSIDSFIHQKREGKRGMRESGNEAFEVALSHPHITHGIHRSKKRFTQCRQEKRCVAAPDCVGRAARFSGEGWMD
mmetsp:Transcript_49548/g.97572  ORF Transcript_49548/g.97572 Transcript_49548/m.97572 type:complete len:95 (-) Transcript_49548:744-1028(-)